jgi:GcrA cell cycle regulator
MTASAWTDDRIGRLKILWIEGRTAEQIARILGAGITRSAVLGKVHRLGLSAGRCAGPTKGPPAPTSGGGASARPFRKPRIKGRGPRPDRGFACPGARTCHPSVRRASRLPLAAR